jgi:S1-C subfamily serine protease
VRFRPARSAHALLVGALVVFAGAACITVEQRGLVTDEPVYLRPGARELRGKPRSAVLRTAKTTVTNQAIDAQTLRRLAKKSGPAVVSLYVQTATPVRIHLLPVPFLPGLPMRLPGRALGSGFFIHPDGYLLTNNHVIQDASRVRALMNDEDETELELEVLARDPVYDLALLKVVDAEQRFEALPMGDSKAMGVGDLVIAVGNPLGLGHTVTHGIISQTGRNLQGVAEDERGVHFLQTDTAINPGSSGGPLIGFSGAWIGVNTAGVVQAQSIGFAVPSSQVAEFLDEVLAGEGVQEP